MTTETPGPGSHSILSSGTSWRRGTAVILVFATLAGSASAGEKIPPNFKIIAEYRSRWFGGWCWETTVTRDGRAVQTIEGGKLKGPAENTFNLTENDLKEFVKIIKDNKFFKLKKSYSGGWTDAPAIALTITAGRSTHRVTLDGFGMLDEDEEQPPKRFMAIWSVVMKKVPAPER
jgi:hypothetical protein